MPTKESNLALAEQVVTALKREQRVITTVESCTGGALAYYITNISGASDVIKDAFVTYSNEAKIALGVSQEIIQKHTVYSIETALAMAEAGLSRSVRADIAIGITGSISRVDPNNPNSEPGEIYLALKYAGRTVSKNLEIKAGRRIDEKDEIVEAALLLILHSLQDDPTDE